MLTGAKGSVRIRPTCDQFLFGEHTYIKMPGKGKKVNKPWANTLVPSDIHGSSFGSLKTFNLMSKTNVQILANLNCDYVNKNLTFSLKIHFKINFRFIAKLSRR